MSLAFYQHLYNETLFLLPQEQAEQAMPAPAAETTPSPKPAAAPPPFAVLGENKKGLVMLVRLPEAAFKALPDLEFLQKLLKAIHHGPGDVAFVNVLQKGPVPLASLRSVATVTNLLSFGLPVVQEDPATPAPPPYSPASAQGTKLLRADELAVIVNSQEKKVQLWNALKQMFLS
jgi:hypothetical protein